MTFRVVSWNLHGLRDDRAAALRMLRELDADVVCLQEVPRLPSTPGTRLRLVRLASATGLRLVRGGRAAAGNALLVSSRVEVVAAEAVRLPSRRWARRRREGHRFARPHLRIGQQRGVVVATLRIHQEDRSRGLVVAAVHLGLDGAERLRHAATVVDLVGQRRRLPVLIAGDLNEPTDGPAWRVLGQAASDPRPDAPPTFPAAAPGQRIDAILVSGGPVSAGLVVVRYGEPAVTVGEFAAASDHRLVVAEFR